MESVHLTVDWTPEKLKSFPPEAEPPIRENRSPQKQHSGKRKMNTSLSGKFALVTGGGRGIGAAIATKLAELGATTVVCGRTLARLQHTAGKIRSSGGQSEAIACDVADWNSVEAL